MTVSFRWCPNTKLSIYVTTFMLCGVKAKTQTKAEKS